MKRILMNMILAIGSAYMGGVGLHAQSYDLKADVPFAFEAGQTSHAAGRYTIVRPPTTPILLLRNVDETKSFSLGLATSHEVSKGNSRLTFHRYGNEYFLAEVWNAENAGTKLPVSAKEKNIRRGERAETMSMVVIECQSSIAGL